MSIIKKLIKEGKLSVPKPFVGETHYECIMGSMAYGVSGKSSDIDVYGMCIPPKEIVFPHTIGYIKGFDENPESFKVLQQHHMISGEKEYDVAIYSIIYYFSLCMDNNPNMIDSLFVPPRCIVHMDSIGAVMRENRKLFLHRGAYHKFKGYAFGQMKKLRTKVPIGKRKESYDKYGYDLKFAYHIFRLILECEMILTESDLDLERNKETLKSVRRGDYTLDEVEAWFARKDESLDVMYLESTLQMRPDKQKIKNVLLACLEEKYGTLDNLIDDKSATKALMQLEQIKQIINQ